MNYSIIPPEEPPMFIHTVSFSQKEKQKIVEEINELWLEVGDKFTLSTHPTLWEMYYRMTGRTWSIAKMTYASDPDV